MEKYVYIFHHTDLDGMGVKVLGMLYAEAKGLPYQTIGCSYGRVNTEVCNAIKIVDDVEEIIIGDISVNEDTAERLDDLYKDGMPIRLRDHHDAAAWLNKYDWALVGELDNDEIARCGTWWLANDDDMKSISQRLKVVIECIDQWDTWKWKESKFEPARKLNSLFSILGEQEFTQYLIDGYKNNTFKSLDDLFSERTQIMLECYNRYISSQVALAEKFMYTMNLWTQISTQQPGVVRKLKTTIKLNTGIVFVTGDLSEVGDRILDNHPELDVLMMIAFPGLISWRTQKDLPISLGKIAQRATGNGGGHPKAAASTISFAQFKDIMTKFMGLNFSPKMDFSNLRSAWERDFAEKEKKRMEAEMNK